MASGADLNSDFIANNGDVLVQAAIDGKRPIFQTSFITGPAIAAVKLVLVLEEYEPEPMTQYAEYAHRQLLSSKVRSFIDFIDGYYGKPPYWDAFSQA